MELPRDTMRVVLPDDASHYEDYPESWDDVEDADTDFDPETFAQEAASPPDPPATDLLSSLTTAAAMEATTPPASSPARVDPNLFTQGMRVTHPEFGLGKITALTGEGKGRTATVQFVTSGEETFQLYFSPLKPV